MMIKVAKSHDDARYQTPVSDRRRCAGSGTQPAYDLPSARAIRDAYENGTLEFSAVCGYCKRRVDLEFVDTSR